MKKEDIKIEFFKSSGPGGQHKNKRFTAVKVTHLPTGLSAVSTGERSQARNKKIALECLGERVAFLNAKKKARVKTILPQVIKHKILESKRIRSRIKALRRKVMSNEI